MKDPIQFTAEQQQIASVIFKYYTPGTVQEHDELIEIDDFVDLWAPIERPNLSEIEKVMGMLGFKDEDARMDLGFFVNIVPKKEPV